MPLSTVHADPTCAVAEGSDTAKTTINAGDSLNFGKINKATLGTMSLGLSSVFSKKDSERGSGSSSRTNPSQLCMFTQNSEVAAEATQSTQPRSSYTPYRTSSVDLSAAGIAASRPKLHLLPR